MKFSCFSWSDTGHQFRLILFKVNGIGKIAQWKDAEGKRSGPMTACKRTPKFRDKIEKKNPEKKDKKE